jgi:hypothetical protein
MPSILLCCWFCLVSFPSHEKPPSREGGEIRKQSPQDGLGRCLLLEVVGESFSALQTHAENLRPNLLRNRGMGELLHRIDTAQTPVQYGGSVNRENGGCFHCYRVGAPPVRVYFIRGGRLDGQAMIDPEELDYETLLVYT